MDKYNSLKPLLHMTNVVYNDGVEHPCLEIDTPFLITKDPRAPDKNKGPKQFQRTVDDFLADVSKKSLVVRSRYGSGKTTFVQRVLQEQNPSKVVFVTYRQALARAMSWNFKHLGFKNYLDSYDDPFVWESPRLIVQIDYLMNLVLKNCDVMDGEAF